MVGSPDFSWRSGHFHSYAAACVFYVTCRWAVSAEAETVWEITENYAEAIERERSAGHVSGIRGVEAGALKGRVDLCFGVKALRNLLTDR